jgi:hypothetical protein
MNPRIIQTSTIARVMRCEDRPCCHVCNYASPPIDDDGVFVLCRRLPKHKPRPGSDVCGTGLLRVCFFDKYSLGGYGVREVLVSLRQWWALRKKFKSGYEHLAGWVSRKEVQKFVGVPDSIYRVIGE